jgi:hypothetical protein
MAIPIKPSEAAALADLLFPELEARSLDNETRTRLAGRLSGLGLSALQPYPGSLARDPAHGSAWYIAADAAEGAQRTPVLLRLALASSHSGEVFQDATLIGRMRPGGGREVIVHAVPFGPADHENIDIFTERVEPGFRPRPHGAHAALVVSGGDAQTGLAPVFDAYGSILKRTGWNAAAVAYTGDSAEGSGIDRWYAAVWSAIRSGWREGYSLEAHHITASSADKTIRDAVAYTKFRLDTSHLFDYRADHRTRYGWSEPDVQRLYDEAIAPELRAWIETEYSRPFDMGSMTHTFALHEVRRLAVKFGGSLLCVEQLYDAISKVKGPHRGGNTGFDYEPVLAGAETITRARELTFCLHWLKARGRPAQSVVPNLAFESGKPYPETTEEQLEYLHGRGWDEVAEYTGVVYPGKPLNELAHRVGELASVARHFGAMLTVEAARGKQPEVFQVLGRATGGQVNIAVSASAAEILAIADNLRS